MASASLLPAEEIAELRRTEREVITSILGSDFNVLDSKAWHGAAQVETYEIILRPDDELQKKHVAVVVHIALTRSYPNTVPTINIRSNDPRTHGVQSPDLTALGEELNVKARTLIGSEMIWELFSTGQEYISAHNNAPKHESPSSRLSLEERMKQRALSEQQDEERRAQREHATREQAETQRSRQLAELIESKKKRQEITIREERKKLRDAPMSAPLPPIEVGRADWERADFEAFAIELVPVANCMMRRGVLLQTLPLTHIFLATLASGSSDTPLGALEITPISSPYYATTSGARKIAEIQSEIAALQRVAQSTPTLVTILGCTRIACPTPDLPQAAALCVVHECVNAWRMSQMLAQCRTLPWPSVRSHLQRILDGLHALHSAGIVHRQVTLDDLLLEQEQIRLAGAGFRRRLIDLHRSNALNAMQTEESSTPDLWRSPEAINDPIAYTAPRDLWDLGRCACQMLFGTHVIHTYTSPEQLFDTMRGSDLDEARAFLERLMHRSPRYRSDAAEMRTLLDETSAALWRMDETLPSRHQGTPRSREIQQRPSTSRRISSRGEPIGSFWQLRNIPNASSQQPVSRYLSDFEEVEFLGKGAFGVVVKAKNKLDGRFYAVKKVRLSSSAAEEERTMREIMTLSRLDHPHIVRYVTCWIEETQVPAFSGLAPDSSSNLSMTTSQQLDASVIRALNRLEPANFDLGSADEDFLSTGRNQGLNDLQSFIKFGDSHENESEEKYREPHSISSTSSDEQESSMSTTSSSSDVASLDNSLPAPMSSSHERGFSTTRVLYIQMEYVENQTLSDAIERGLSIDEAWHIFRQMLEALAHIASVGIIHRDLKPSNVLMYANGDIKIGDFGLATTSFQTIETELRESVLHEQATGDPSESTELTSGLGTFSYIAPEVLAKRGLSTRYNFKVDMFSLGIMFFEMIASQRCYKTTMERYQLLRDLRQPTIQFPSSWDTAQFPAQTEIIRQLLDHDPSKRPSPMEMLRSPSLPPKMQDEYLEELLRLAAQPASTHRHQLIASLFAKADIDELRDFTFDTGAQSDEDDVLVGVVCQHVRSVFQKRGAVPVHPPLLVPPNDIYAGESDVVKLLDKTGNLVLLPHDLTVPFARVCARSGHSRMKRFDIADVYRENLLAGGQPRAVLAASYDIISPEIDHASEAEILGVLDELLQIPGLASVTWEMELGHAAISSTLLARFPARLRSSIQSVLPLLFGRSSERRARQQLSQLGMSASQLDELNSLHLRGDVNETIQQLVSLLTPGERVSLAGPIAEVKQVALLAHQFGVQHGICFAPMLAYGSHRYENGIIITVVNQAHSKRREVLAVGGRYDALLRRFAYPSTTSATMPTPSAVGVQVAIGKIVAALAKYQQVQVPRLMSRPEEERTLGPWTPRRCECYLAASAPGLLDLRIQLCTLLWTNGVSADLQYEISVGESLEATTAMCRAEGILFLILLRAHSPALKIREVIPRTEHEVLREDLLPFLHDRIARQRRIDLHTAGGTQARPSVPDMHSKAPVTTKHTPTPTVPAPVRTVAASEVHVTMPTKTDRSRRDRDRHNDRRSKAGAHQVVAEKAAAEATRLTDAMASGKVPVFAVDLAPNLLTRFASVAAGSEEAFRTQFNDITNEEREYLKNLRVQISHALGIEEAGPSPTAATNTSISTARSSDPNPASQTSTNSGRALLYSIRDGRMLLTE
ncbi:non-specific serine/threonine protein kinase [Malassezia psittaci]|uniref:non-specific serine/threonine protein kinase n=1 Tax=Malassezia psittaci TaxID=1821823 RepID=A0AAF0FDR6_9BASI|nr:non-specific serine/threonine protein kinase [Malassezia psittaci]